MCENAAERATTSQILRQRGGSCGSGGGRAAAHFSIPPPGHKIKNPRFQLANILSSSFSSLNFGCWISNSSSIGFLMCAFSAQRCVFFPSVLPLSGKPRSVPTNPGPGRGPISPPPVTSYQAAPRVAFLLWSKLIPYVFRHLKVKHRKNCECCPVSQLIVR